MKNLKSIVIIISVLLSSMIYAQPPGGGQGGQQGPPPIPNAKQIKKMVSQLADEINLSEEQESTVLKLYQEHFEEVEEMTSGQEKPNRKEMDSLKSNFQNQVEDVLNDDQKTAYQEYLKEQSVKKPKK